MANNRLYIVDAKTGNKFCLAKSFGDGWQTWHDSPEMLVQDLEEFFDGADGGASLGNCSEMKSTELILVTEYDIK